MSRDCWNQSECFISKKHITHAQCDQIWRFSKVVDSKFSHQRGSNIWKLFGLFWSMSLYNKCYFCYFWTSAGNFGLILITASGHTATRKFVSPAVLGSIIVDLYFLNHVHSMFILHRVGQWLWRILDTSGQCDQMTRLCFQ